jgi:integrase/recombinase XerD
MKVNNKIPYFFSEEEVLAIFNATTNLKHYTMLSLMFYCVLRAGDIINLEDDDINMKTMTLRIRDGKFGKSAILPIPQTSYRSWRNNFRFGRSLRSVNTPFSSRIARTNGI